MFFVRDRAYLTYFPSFGSDTFKLLIYRFNTEGLIPMLINHNFNSMKELRPYYPYQWQPSRKLHV